MWRVRQRALRWGCGLCVCGGCGEGAVCAGEVRSSTCVWVLLVRVMRVHVEQLAIAGAAARACQAAVQAKALA